MFLLNIQSKVPIYEQIETQISSFIKAGVLKEGDRLPSVRQLAKDNGINPNTVTKAYAILEKNGYVYNFPKKGVYVAKVTEDSSRNEALMKMIENIKENGYSENEVLEATRMVYQTEGGSKDVENRKFDKAVWQ